MGFIVRTLFLHLSRCPTSTLLSSVGKNAIKLFNIFMVIFEKHN